VTLKTDESGRPRLVATFPTFLQPFERSSAFTDSRACKRGRCCISSTFLKAVRSDMLTITTTANFASCSAASKRRPLREYLKKGKDDEKEVMRVRT